MARSFMQMYWFKGRGLTKLIVSSTPPSGGFFCDYEREKEGKQILSK